MLNLTFKDRRDMLEQKSGVHSHAENRLIRFVCLTKWDPTFSQGGLPNDTMCRGTKTWMKHAVTFWGSDMTIRLWHKLTNGAIIHLSLTDSTHRSRPRERHSTLVHTPVVVGFFPVGERSVECRANIFHVVHAHGVTFEHSTERKPNVDVQHVFWSQ